MFRFDALQSLGGEEGPNYPTLIALRAPLKTFRAAANDLVAKVEAAAWALKEFENRKSKSATDEPG